MYYRVQIEAQKPMYWVSKALSARNSETTKASALIENLREAERSAGKMLVNKNMKSSRKSWRDLSREEK